MLKARRHCAELGRITKSLCPAAIAPRLRHIGEIARSHVLNTRMRSYMQLLHFLSPGINLVPHHLATRSMPCIRRPGSSPRYCCPTAAKSRKTIMLPPLCSANQRVTDGARTRDLRSHNPMLCLLSYGHHAPMNSTSENARNKTRHRRDSGSSIPKLVAPDVSSEVFKWYRRGGRI
jgi:hypothetical protein